MDENVLLRSPLPDQGSLRFDCPDLTAPWDRVVSQRKKKNEITVRCTKAASGGEKASDRDDILYC